MEMVPESYSEDSPRLRGLSEFLAEHYMRSDKPTHKLDGGAMFRNHAVWATGRDLEIPTRMVFYNDLRTLGFLVRPYTNNRTTVFGIVEKATARHAVACLEAGWADVSMTIQERKAESRLERQSRIAFEDVLLIKRELTEEALAVVLSTMRESPDERVRLQAAAMILDRTIPKLRALALEEESEEEPEVEEEVVEEEVIEVVEEVRTSVAEVEALHAKILAEHLALVPGPVEAPRPRHKKDIPDTPA